MWFVSANWRQYYRRRVFILTRSRDCFRNDGVWSFWHCPDIREARNLLRLAIFEDFKVSRRKISYLLIVFGDDSIDLNQVCADLNDVIRINWRRLLLSRRRRSWLRGPLRRRILDGLLAAHRREKQSEN